MVKIKEKEHHLVCVEIQKLNDGSVDKDIYHQP